MTTLFIFIFYRIYYRGFFSIAFLMCLSYNLRGLGPGAVLFDVSFLLFLLDCSSYGYFVEVLSL
jgi:hypothetical protein